MIAVRAPVPVATAPLGAAPHVGGSLLQGSRPDKSVPPWPPSDSEDVPTSETPSSASLSCETAACSTPLAPPTTPVVAAGPVPAAGEQTQRAVYSACDYWDSRYAQRATHFDWFFSYSAVRPLLRHAMTLPALPALHVGCGNSDLSIGLGADGTPVRPLLLPIRGKLALWPQHGWVCKGLWLHAFVHCSSCVQLFVLHAVMCCQ